MIADTVTVTDETGELAYAFERDPNLSPEVFENTILEIVELLSDPEGRGVVSPLLHMSGHPVS